MSNEDNPTTSSSASPADEPNAVLADALAMQRPRFFRVAGGAARGRTGRKDTERFADELVTLQECAQILGERLEMNAIAFGIVYDRDDTVAFRYDPSSDPR
ncbi:MAG: hypothetical protein KDM64_18390, partial [Verrucomicrobiae bacterium]|nr:hypothetical protein [Verrucomicrobiae bacterium]